jgi:hypothetical protein
MADVLQCAVDVHSFGLCGCGQSTIAPLHVMAMATWSVLLLPPLGALRARPRRLCPTGAFSLQLQRAWRLADPETARARLVQACSTPAEHPLQNGSGRSVVVEL